MRRRNHQARTASPSPSQKSRKRTLFVQSLEQRSLLAADIVLADAFVQIHGTEHQDVAEVYQQDDQLVVNYKQFDAGGILLEESQHTFGRDKVESIFFQGGEGDDVFVNESDVSSLAMGGPGNDMLLGGTARDVLVGGADDDVLLGGDGNDLLLGGSGENVLLDSSGMPVVPPAVEEPVEETCDIEELPIEESPIEEPPVEETPVEETCEIEEPPVEVAPVEEAPEQETCEIEEAPVEEAPIEETPVEETCELEEAPEEVMPPVVEAEEEPCDELPAEEPIDPAPIVELECEVDPNAVEEQPLEEPVAEDPPLVCDGETIVIDETIEETVPTDETPSEAPIAEVSEEDPAPVDEIAECPDPLPMPPAVCAVADEVKPADEEETEGDDETLPTEIVTLDDGGDEVTGEACPEEEPVPVSVVEDPVPAAAVTAQPGNDILVGGNGHDLLFGGDGDDWVFGDSLPDDVLAQLTLNQFPWHLNAA